MNNETLTFATSKSHNVPAVKLNTRGPFKVETDCVLDMDADGNILLTFQNDTVQIIIQLASLQVGVELVELVGPAGGNPLVNLHGTEEALRKVFLEMYELDETELEIYTFEKVGA